MGLLHDGLVAAAAVAEAGAGPAGALAVRAGHLHWSRLVRHPANGGRVCTACAHTCGAIEQLQALQARSDGPQRWSASWRRAAAACGGPGRRTAQAQPAGLQRFTWQRLAGLHGLLHCGQCVALMRCAGVACLLVAGWPAGQGLASQPGPHWHRRRAPAGPAQAHSAPVGQEGGWRVVGRVKPMDRHWQQR